MKTGLLSPLGAPEEVALRRIAHGSLTIDPTVAAKLIKLALAERARNGLRLTPLGQMRYDALPKAPLLSRPRSIHAAAGYVEGIIEKAQQRAQVQPVPAAVEAMAPLAPAPEMPRTQADAERMVRPWPPGRVLFDDQQFKHRLTQSSKECARR